MKKLILGIAMFFVGFSRFTELYNITTALRTTPMAHSDDLGLFASIIFSAIMLIIGFIGLAVAVSGAKEKKNTDAKTE